MKENIFVIMEVVFTKEKITDIAKEIIAITKRQKIYAINGEMGAGKTTFIHAFCEAMGVTGNISSPTFSIINQYSTITGKIIYHMDLYRIKDEEEAIACGVEDCLLSGEICLVEWPEKAAGILPPDTLQLYINALDDNTRKLTFEPVD